MVHVTETYLLTCFPEVGPTPMKSKLTLRLDENLKERAKRLADRRGTSVSKIVEHYFKLLLQEDALDASGEGVSSSEDRSNGDQPGADQSGADQSGADQSGAAAEEIGLSPRIQKLKEKLGKPAPEVNLDEDTQRWVEAAAEKHA